MSERIVAAILAGGESARFGADKAMADLGGAPMIVRVGERLRAQADALAVVGHAPGAAALQCVLLHDPAVGVRGPLLGVLAGLEWAKAEGAQWLITAPCDTPFIPADMARRLVSAAREAGVSAAHARTPDGMHPLCAAWSPQLAPKLAAHFAAGAHPQVRTVAPDAVQVFFENDDAFANVNTPEEYERICARKG